MKFSFKDFFSKSDQIRSFLQIWSHIRKKCLMENFIFLCGDIKMHFISIKRVIFPTACYFCNMLCVVRFGTIFLPVVLSFHQ